MIKANEMKKMTNKEMTQLKMASLQNAVDVILNAFEEKMKKAAGYGVREITVQKSEITKLDFGICFFTNKQIIDETIKQLKHFGYKAYATPSYSSVHVSW